MPDAPTLRLDVTDEPSLRLFEECLTASGGFDSPGESRPPDVLLVEIAAGDPEPLTTLAKARDATPGAILLATSSIKDPGFLIEAMRLGLRDFFPQPVEREAVMKALERIKTSLCAQPPSRGKNGKIIGVMGVKGGVGTTTVCVNLAAALQEALGGSSVALMDMNMPYGETQLFLDITPKYDMGEIMRNLDRLDALYLMDVLARHDSGLRVLPCPASAEDLQMISPDTVAAALTMLTDLFDLVVADMGIYLDEVTLKAMELSSSVFLVAEQNLACLASLRRMAAHVRSSQPEVAGKLSVLINRARPEGDVGPKELEEATGVKTFFELPLDYDAATDAINQGKTVLELFPKSALAKGFRSLASRLAPGGDGRCKKRGLFGLDGLFSHKGT